MIDLGLVLDLLLEIPASLPILQLNLVLIKTAHLQSMLMLLAQLLLILEFLVQGVVQDQLIPHRHFGLTVQKRVTLLNCRFEC